MRNSPVSNSSSSSSNTGGGRAVQFSSVEITGSDSLSIEEDQEQEEIGHEEEHDDDYFKSWNERMRHEEPPQEPGKAGTCLGNLISKLFLVTMERSWESLTILRKMYGMHFEDVHLEYVPLEGKYVGVGYDVYYPVKSETWKTCFKKLRHDISWLEKILVTTIMNLRKNWNFESLVKILNDDQIMREEEDTLLSSKKFNQNELTKLRFYEEAERQELVKNIQQVTEELGNLKDELNDNIVEYDVKIRYLKKWENARHEQNKIVLKKQEEAFSHTSKTMATETDRKSRVHEEFEAFLEEALSDCKQGIEDWMNKYDAEMDQFDEKIQKLKVNVESQREAHINLVEKFDRRKEIMEEYKLEKQRKKEEAEKQERRVKAATKIQAWWRGVMFRKGLGPWRRKKGKGKKGGSAKGSGKKKNNKS